MCVPRSVFQFTSCSLHWWTTAARRFYNLFSPPLAAVPALALTPSSAPLAVTFARHTTPPARNKKCFQPTSVQPSLAIYQSSMPIRPHILGLKGLSGLHGIEILLPMEICVSDLAIFGTLYWHAPVRHHHQFSIAGYHSPLN